MAHAAQQQFCTRVRDLLPSYFEETRVLEIGARNINGSVRRLFRNCEITGVDATAGAEVDVVCLGHQFEAPPGHYDVVCSIETFEHDPYAEETVNHMLHLLRPGGLFFMTCAGEGRPEHGTRRTGKLYGPEPDFYRNVSIQQFLKWLAPVLDSLQAIHVERNEAASDLYAYAVKM